MKKSLFLILLFLLYQILAGVMAKLWTSLSGSLCAETHAAQAMSMPSATALGISMLVSMAVVLCLVFALKLVRRCPWRSSLEDVPVATIRPDGKLQDAATPISSGHASLGKVIAGRPVNGAGWGVAVVGFVLLSLGMNLLLAPFQMDDLGMENLFDGMKDSLPCLFLLSVAGPVFEEIIFREGVLRQLVHTRRKAAPEAGGLTPFWAILVSAFCFGVIHGNPAQAVPAFVLGLALGLCYCRTGNIVLCAVLHVLNNSMAVALMYLPSFNNSLEHLPVALSVSLGLAGVLVGALSLSWMYLSAKFTLNKFTLKENKA